LALKVTTIVYNPPFRNSWIRPCCASNLQQGDGEVPSPSVLKKAKLWNDSVARNCWRNAEETLKMIHVQAHRKVTDNDLKEIDTIPDMRRLFLLF